MESVRAKRRFSDDVKYVPSRNKPPSTGPERYIKNSSILDLGKVNDSI